MLSPYRVLDLCDERGAFAGQVLAMLGAEVVLAEPPDGSPLRRQPPFIADQPGPDRSLVHHALNRGKKSVIAGSRAALRELAAGADVLLECGPPSADLADAHPGLVHVTISAFGTTGPKADWAATDLVVGAAGAQLAITGNADKPPLRCAVPQTWLHASIDAATAALLALHQRARSGLGQRVDISAQHSWTLAAFHYPLYPAWGEPDVSRNGSHIRIGAVASRFEYPAADGHVTLLLLFGAAVGPFTARMVQWMAEEGACHPSLVDVDWTGFRPDLDTVRYERLKSDVAAFFATRTRADLFAASQRRKLLIAPVTTLDDVLASPQFAARKLWRELELPDAPAARVPGPFVQATPRPLPELAPAPALGAHDGQLAPRPPFEGSGERPAQPEPADVAPLQGLKVLDLTISFAGPTVGRILADFGATVVKVESLKRPDLARTAGPFLGGDDLDRSACFAHYNAGKQSIALDLSKPAAKPVLADLARWADVLVESYAPGALARMGLDTETLRRLNPHLIALSSSMVGQSGPYAGIAGYGNMASSLCGFYSVTAWPDRDPVGPMGAYTDIISPRLATAALLAALDDRRRTGTATTFDFGQGESCLHLLTLGLLDRQVNGRSWEGQGNDDLTMAPHGVYPAAGEERWVAIAVQSDEQWHTLTGLLGRTDLAPLDAEQRLGRRRELDELVADWTATREPGAVEAVLQGLGVPAHQVQRGAECLRDPQLHHRGWAVEATHDRIGGLTIGRSPMQLSRTPADSSRAGPCLGAHSFEVLTEHLGYDSDRIADLAAAELLE